MNLLYFLLELPAYHEPLHMTLLYNYRHIYLLSYIYIYIYAKISKETIYIKDYVYNKKE